MAAFGTLFNTAIITPVKALFGGLYNTLLGGLSKIPGAILGLMRNLAVNAFNTLSTAFKGLLVTIGAAAAGLVLAFKSAITSAREFGKAALTLRANTGASYGQAGQILTRGLAFGMSPGETAGNFSNRNPLTAGMFGNDYRSPNYYSNLSRQFNAGINSGPMGFMLTRNLLKMQGATDSDLEIAAMDPKKVKAQEDWTQSIGSKLGLDSKSVQSAAEDLRLGLAKLGTIFELLKLKLWQAIGPQVIAGIEKFAKFLTDNSGRISSILERIGGALSTVFLKGLDVVIGWLDKNADRISDFIQKAFHFLILEFPPLLLRTGAFVTGALASIVKAFAVGLTALIKLSPLIAKVFYSLTNAFLTNLPSILGLTKLVFQGFSSLAKEVLGIIQLLTGKQTSATSPATGIDVNSNQGTSKGAASASSDKVDQENSGQRNTSSTPQNKPTANSKTATQSANQGGLVTDVYNIWKNVTGAAGRGARHIGNMLGFDTGDPNKETPGSELFNNIVGGAITSVLAKLTIGPALGAAGNVLSGLAAPVIGAAGNAVGGIWGSLMTAASLNTGSILGGSLSLPGTMAAAAAGWPLLAGGAVGALGYEGLRKTGIMGNNMPSTIQMGMYGFNRIMGDSPDEAHRRIWGITSQSTAQRIPSKTVGTTTGATTQPDLRIPYPTTGSGSPVQDLMTRLAIGTNNGLQLSLKNLQEHGPLLAKNADRAATWLENKSMELNSAADRMQGEMQKLLEEANQRLASIDRNTKNTSGNLLNLLAVLNVAERILAYNAQDSALAQVR